MTEAKQVDLGYRPREQFVHFHRSKRRWTCMICHRRAGKTTACLMEMLSSAIRTEKGRYAYIAPLRNQAKVVAWEMLKAFARPVLKGGPNEAELRVDLFNGARITLFGADNPDALRGQAFDGVVLDEYADMPPSLFGPVIRPALTDRGGFAILVGTVKGRNQLWEQYERAKDDPDWYTTLLRASQTHILPESELADARRMMAPEQYDSEFECDPYAAILGAYYGKDIQLAEMEGRVLDGHQIHGIVDPVIPVHTAWDLGIGDSTAIWFWQVSGNEIRIVDYYENHGKNLAHYVSELSAKGYRYGKDFVPHDARVRELGTGKTRVETLSALGRTPTLIPAHKVMDGINAARLMLHRCWFDGEKCAEGLEALRQYRTDFDERKRIFTEAPRHDWTSHAADAFRYLAMAWQEMSIPEPPKHQIIFRDLEEMSYDDYDAIGRRRRDERA